MSKGGEITRVILGESIWTSKGDMNIVATNGDVCFSANKKVNFYGVEEGVHIGDYDFKEEENKEIAFSGWWSPDYEGTQNLEHDDRGSKSFLEKTVYYQLTVSTDIPLGTSIQFKLWDYDTGLFLDWLNPDDDKLAGKEVIKTGIVRDVNGKHRITIELFLNPNWDNDIRKDKGAFKDGCVDFYWTWRYNNANWTSQTNLLSVYPSNVKLRIKPAFEGGAYSLPEIYSRKGYIIAFAIDRLPNGEIQKFVSIKIRSTTTFHFESDVQKFKKEIYSETINIKKNTVEALSYEVEEISHFFRIKENITNVFVDEKLIEVPVTKGSSIAVFNKIKKTINFGKTAADIFTYHQVLDEIRNMMPEISSNGKFNTPSVSTVLSFIPGYQIAAFGVFLFEWMAQGLLAEADQNFQEQMWITWQNTKAKGLDSVMSFIENSWATNNRFDKILVSRETLNAVLKGKFRSIEEIRIKRFENIDPLTHTIITYRIEDKELDTYYDLVDCIFMNEEI